jgi:ABC-type phosphate transport system substrate-binding protein
LSKKSNLSLCNALSEKALEPVKQTAVVLGDDNPRNAEQVEAVWKNFAHLDLDDFAENEVLLALQKIENPDIKKVLETLAVPTVSLLRIVTDDDKNDQAQIKQLFDGFIKDEQTQAVALEHIVIPFLVNKIKDESLRDFVIEFLRGALSDND